MAEPARKFTPEEEEYYRKLAKEAQNRRVFDGVQRKPDPNYVPPDLQMIGDDEGEDEGDSEAVNDGSSEGENQDDSIDLDDIRDVKRAIDRSKGETPQKQLERGNVPKYEAQPPEAIKKPPGGPALKAKTPVGSATKTGQGAAKTAQGAVQTARNAGQAVVKAGQAIAKAVQAAVAAIRTAVAAAVALFETAPVWVPILLIVLGILIIVGGVVILLKARQTPNANGASPTIAADIVADHELIRTVLSLSDQNEFQKLLEENKSKLTTDINEFISDVQGKYPGDSRLDTTINKLEQAKTLIATYTTPDSSRAAEIQNLIIDAVKPWTVTLNPDGMIWPPGNGYRNISNSFRHMKHDGIDIYLPIGTPLYAATDGEIVYVYNSAPNWPAGSNHYRDKNARKPPHNSGFGNMIIVKMDQTINGANYWEIHHLSPGTMYHKVNGVNINWNVGDRVRQGELIALSGHNGISSNEHLHFGTCSEFHGSSCNGKGNHQYGVDPTKVLGWR